MSKQKNVPDDKLERAYKIVATIVRDHGDKYLPVFQRLHDERNLRAENRNLKNIALHIAQNMIL